MGGGRGPLELSRPDQASGVWSLVGLFHLDEHHLHLAERLGQHGAVIAEAVAEAVEHTAEGLDGGCGLGERRWFALQVDRGQIQEADQMVGDHLSGGRGGDLAAHPHHLGELRCELLALLAGERVQVDAEGLSRCSQRLVRAAAPAAPGSASASSGRLDRPLAVGGPQGTHDRVSRARRTRRCWPGAGALVQ
ncbi:MAG: hypothetical protein V9E94_18310 [Microthrixaceae bacterium]